jgi:opacity protein-like surface antigen
MKTTLIALATTLALATTAAAAEPAPEAADHFSNTTASVTANWDRFTFELEGSEDGGYTSATVGAEVLAYTMGEHTTNTLDVYLTHQHAVDDFELGAEYTVTYAPNAWSVYGAAEVEYRFANDTVGVTPTLGAAYVAAEAVTVWGEVGYTLDATNDWAQEGGVAEVGVDFAVASNIMLTPSVVYAFDRAGYEDEAQLNLGLNLSF